MRVFITIAPLMYRESLALNLQRHHPSFEVLLGAPGSLDGEAKGFAPHLLIHSDIDGTDAKLREEVLCRIEILYKDSMSAIVSLDGEIWEIEDISTADLLGIVERVEKLAGEEAPEGG